MFELFTRLLFDGASALAAGLTVYVALSTMLNVAQRIHQRRRPQWLRQLQRPDTPLPAARAKQSNVGRLILLGAATGLALKAAVTGGALVALFLLVVGLALYVYLGRRTSSMAGRPCNCSTA